MFLCSLSLRERVRVRGFVPRPAAPLPIKHYGGKYVGIANRRVIAVGDGADEVVEKTTDLIERTRLHLVKVPTEQEILGYCRVTEEGSAMLSIENNELLTRVGP